MDTPYTLNCYRDASGKLRWNKWQKGRLVSEGGENYERLAPMQKTLHGQHNNPKVRVAVGGQFMEIATSQLNSPALRNQLRRWLKSENGGKATLVTATTTTGATKTKTTGRTRTRTRARSQKKTNLGIRARRTTTTRRRLSVA